MYLSSWYLEISKATFSISQGNHIAGHGGRIHCSLNINTETGRLSARRPNLQVIIFIQCLSYHGFKYSAFERFSPTCGRFGYIRTRWSSEVDPRPSMLSSTTLGETPTHGTEEVPASRILCLCKRPRVLLHFLNEIRGVPLRAPLLHCSKKIKKYSAFEIIILPW